MKQTELATKKRAEAARAKRAEHARATGIRIRARRRKLGITCEALAQNSELTVSYLYSIERGKYAPSLLKLRGLASALKCTVDALTSGAVPDLPAECNTRESIAAQKRGRK